MSCNRTTHTYTHSMTNYIFNHRRVQPVQRLDQWGGNMIGKREPLSYRFVGLVVSWWG